jgi:beta-galactosidase
LVHPLLAQAPRLCLWRALTDNDLSAPLDQRFVRAGYFSLTDTAVRVSTGANGTVVVTTYSAAFGDEIVHRQSISTLGDGDFLLDEMLTLPDESQDVLRVGMMFALAPGFDTVDWVGLGPWENYPDRRFAAITSLWSKPIAAMSVPYLRPQENGTRGDVTWVEIKGPQVRVQVIPDRPVHVNVSRHSIADLESADHWWELSPRDTTFVHVDVAHRGVGTGRIGPDTAPEFRVVNREYRWRWRLRLLTDLADNQLS